MRADSPAEIGKPVLQLHPRQHPAQGKASARFVIEKLPEIRRLVSPSRHLNRRQPRPVGVNRPLPLLRIEQTVGPQEGRAVAGEKENPIQIVRLGIGMDKPAVAGGEQAAVHKAVFVLTGTDIQPAVEPDIYQPAVQAAR